VAEIVGTMSLLGNTKLHDACDTSRARTPAPRRVAVVGFPGVQLLDVTGPLEVFGRTNRWLRDEKGFRGNAYDLALIARRTGPLTTSSGLQLVATHSTRNAGKAFHTLLVAGGPGTPLHPPPHCRNSLGFG